MVICLTILGNSYKFYYKASTTQIIVDQSTVYRDCGFYILSTVVTLWFAYLGYIYWWSAAVFILIN